MSDVIFERTDFGEMIFKMSEEAEREKLKSKLMLNMIDVIRTYLKNDWYLEVLFSELQNCITTLENEYRISQGWGE